MNKKTFFPNMAGSQCKPELIEKELIEAGIKVYIFPRLTENSEVDCGFQGVIEFKGGYWEFKRAWYYWVAKGPGIPPKEAMELHNEFGKVVRVNGNCGCPPPSEAFATDSYHIDTQEGLNAFAKLIKILAEKGKITRLINDAATKNKQEQLAKETEAAIINQSFCYDTGEDESECFSNEYRALQDTAATVARAFKKLWGYRRIAVCEFCERNGMQDESEICQKECPARPKTSEFPKMEDV